jgi:hypothetical protein
VSTHPTGPTRPLLVALVVLALFEVATLTVLLVNLFTAHLRPITQTMGPIHGAVYLVIVVIMVFAPGFRRLDRFLGVIPVVGGTLAVARIVRARNAGGQA